MPLSNPIVPSVIPVHLFLQILDPPLLLVLIPAPVSVLPLALNSVHPLVLVLVLLLDPFLVHVLLPGLDPILVLFPPVVLFLAVIFDPVLPPIRVLVRPPVLPPVRVLVRPPVPSPHLDLVLQDAVLFLDLLTDPSDSVQSTRVMTVMNRAQLLVGV